MGSNDDYVNDLTKNIMVYSNGETDFADAYKEALFSASFLGTEEMSAEQRAKQIVFMKGDKKD